MLRRSLQSTEEANIWIDSKHYTLVDRIMEIT